MYNIDLNKVITLVRGDTFIYDYKINIGTDLFPEYYDMQEGDYLYFGIMEPNQVFEESVIKKRYGFEDFEDGKIKIKLNSDDTECLTTGKYYYTIKLVKNKDGDDCEVITTQPNTLFFLV